MNDSALGVYITRGQRFAEGMRYLRDHPEHSHLMAAGLLAAHSAITFNDAALIKLTGKSGKSSDHKQAPEMTRKACRANGLDASGIIHLVKLIRFKDQFAYQDKTISSDEISKYCETSERFETWVKRMLKGEL
jgi:hypothetical protein